MLASALNALKGTLRSPITQTPPASPAIAPEHITAVISAPGGEIDIEAATRALSRVATTARPTRERCKFRSATITTASAARQK